MNGALNGIVSPYLQETAHLHTTSSTRKLRQKKRYTLFGLLKDGFVKVKQV